MLFFTSNTINLSLAFFPGESRERILSEFDLNTQAEMFQTPSQYRVNA